MHHMVGRPQPPAAAEVVVAAVMHAEDDVPATGHGPLVSYVVPTAREGGIWGAGGLPMAHGTIYAGVGNGAATGGAYDDSDSVTALSPGLHRTGIFAPVDWAADNAMVVTSRDAR